MNWKPDHRAEEMVALFNRVINEPDPTSRVQIAREIGQDLGRWMMCPTPMLEQLLNKLELEINKVTHYKSDHPLMQLFLDVERHNVLVEAHKIMAIIRAFLEVRPQFRESIMRQLPDYTPIPE